MADIATSNVVSAKPWLGLSNVASATTPTGGGFDNTVTGNQPSGFTVPAGQNWKIQGLVTSPANVIVEGTLTMRAGDTLRFTGVNEANFVGEGSNPIASDIGLWVMGAGKLDVQGTPRVAWNRTGTDPTWTTGHELIVAPTAAGEWLPQHFLPFTLGGTVPQARADLPKAEVLNLTRDVAVEGTATGRSHVFIRSTSPQTVKFARLQHLGPRKNGEKILGRWPLHFHNNGEGSRGSIVEGVVGRDHGSHSFVPHGSNGITFLNCIAFNVTESPYWWDSDVPADDPTDTTFDGCVAAAVAGGDPRNAGFRVGKSNGLSTIRNCVGVGVYGGADATGYHWTDPTPWVFDDNVGHNNKMHGHSVWENANTSKTVRRLITYRNGADGNNQGAYNSAYAYEDCLFALNGAASNRQHSASRADFQNRYVRTTFDGVMVSTKHNLPFGQPTLFLDSTFTAGVYVDDLTAEPSLYDFVRCGLEPANFQIAHLQPGARIRVQRPDNTAFQITPSGTATIGQFYPYA